MANPLKRISLFKEGSRLSYISEIAKLVLHYRGSAYEDIIASALSKIGEAHSGVHKKMKLQGTVQSSGTAWGYLNNAETIGLVQCEGSTKGERLKRKRLVSLTPFGQATAIATKILGEDRKTFLELSLGERILYLYRFLELEDIWRGEWILGLLNEIPTSSFREETQIISTFASKTFLRNRKSQTQFHRIFPRLQWLCDLKLVIQKYESSNRGRKRYYRLLPKTKELIKTYPSVDCVLQNICETIVQAYNIQQNQKPQDFESEFTTLHKKIQKSLSAQTPFLRIGTVKYLMSAKFASLGYTLDDKEFNDDLLHLWNTGKVEIVSVPAQSEMKADLTINGRKFFLVGMR